MNIKKAIEIGTKTLKANYKFLDPDFRDFVQLGIEALRDKETERIVLAALSKQLLPGETHD